MSNRSRTITLVRRLPSASPRPELTLLVMEAASASPAANWLDQALPVMGPMGSNNADSLAALEDFLKEHHQTTSWHYILNTTTSTKPKANGGPTIPSLSALKVCTCAPGSASDACVHTCSITLPCSFAAGDGQEVAASASAPTAKKADESACLKVFAELLRRDSFRVVLHNTHWRCSVADLLAGISSIVGGRRQAPPPPPHEPGSASSFPQ